MKKAIAVWVVLTVVVLGATCPVSAIILRSNGFSSDPQWAGFNNTSGQNSYGYSGGTANAGGATGEVGGTFGRQGFYSYFGDTNLSLTMNLTYELAASGQFKVTSLSSFDNALYLGHFSKSTAANADDMVGLQISEVNGSTVRVRGVVHDPNSPYTNLKETTYRNIAVGDIIGFNYEYNPLGGGTGNGQLSLTLTNLSLATLISSDTVDLTASDRSVAYALDSWGFSVPAINDVVPNTATLFLDNVAYSIPEPSSLSFVLVALAGLAMRRKNAQVD